MSMPNNQTLEQPDTSDQTGEKSLEPFRLAEWLIDPASNEVSLGEEKIRLEPRVMAVLAYLAERQGEVVTREELEAAVWVGMVVGYDAITGSIQKLRRALHDDPNNPRIIETLSKKGYRLIAPVVPVKPAAPPSVRSPSADSPSPEPVPDKKNRMVWLAGIFVSLLAVVVAFFMTRLGPLEPRPEEQSSASGPISIAVLPFENLNADPTQQYFVDGIADDLITELAVIPHLTVIARDSSFNYREKHRNLKEIASALNVRYLIDGTVSKANDRVRINAHLDDTTTGTQIWANGFEGSTKDIFNLRHRITKSVISALAVKLTPAEEQYVSRPDTTNLDAYKQYLHGTQRFFLYAKASNVEARDFFTKAIDLDPKMARAHAMLGWTNAFDFMNGWSNKPDQSLDDAEQQATQALALDKNLPVAYFVRGLVYRERGEYAKGLVEAEHAIALDPNYANGHVLYATLLYYAGRPQDGLEQMKQAIQLNPHYPFNYPFHLGQAYFVLKRYDEAIAAFKSGLGSDPSEERLHVWLAAAYAQSGRLKDAKWEADEVLVANPDFSLKKLKRAFPFSNRADLANFVEGARKAGLPE